MFKSTIAYILGFISGLLFIVNMATGKPVYISIIFIVATYAISMLVASRIHLHMKDKHEKRMKGIYNHDRYI